MTPIIVNKRKPYITSTPPARILPRCRTYWIRYHDWNTLERKFTLWIVKGKETT